MRLNKYIAVSSSLSRRAADAAIAAGRVTVNGKTPETGSQVKSTDVILLDGVKLIAPEAYETILFHKPVGYVCSKKGQGSETIYDILPKQYRHLNPVGRLDKDSSGLLLLTDNGALAEQLTHPRYAKMKRYEVSLDKPLEPLHGQMISDHGIMLDDGNSRFLITSSETGKNTYEVQMTEGRNRQIRRTFAALGYAVKTLHRTHFGPYALSDLSAGSYQKVS